MSMFFCCIMVIKTYYDLLTINSIYLLTYDQNAFYEFQLNLKPPRHFFLKNELNCFDQTKQAIDLFFFSLKFHYRSPTQIGFSSLSLALFSIYFMYIDIFEECIRFYTQSIVVHSFYFTFMQVSRQSFSN